MKSLNRRLTHIEKKQKFKEVGTEVIIVKKNSDDRYFNTRDNKRTFESQERLMVYYSSQSPKKKHVYIVRTIEE